MARSSAPKPLPSAPMQLRGYFDALLEAYGPQEWWPAETSLEVIVGAYLTQNTSWAAVEQSIANLRGRGLLNLEGLRGLDVEELQKLIRPSGFMKRKAAAIQAFIAWLDREYEGSIEVLAAQPMDRLRMELLDLPGVGEETADAILLYALGHPAMVVDEYLRRIATRHGLAREGASYGELRQLGVAAFGRDAVEDFPALANEFHALVVAVGKRHCSRKPKCSGCPLESSLP